MIGFSFTRLVEKLLSVKFVIFIAAVFAVLFIKEMLKQVRHDKDDLKEDVDEINRKAAAKREEAVSRISNTDDHTLCECYGTVCDTIADGKERFRRRCRGTDN